MLSPEIQPRANSVSYARGTLVAGQESSCPTDKTQQSTRKEEGFWKSFFKSFASIIQPGPGLSQLGIQAHSMTMGVRNCTYYTAYVVAYGRLVAKLAPGDGVYDKRYFENQMDIQIPIMVLFSTGASGNEFVGAAGKVFSISLPSTAPTGFAWLIEEYEINFMSSQNRAPAMQASDNKHEKRKVRKVRFPREWLGGTVGIQVVNNTPYAATVLLRDERVARLVPGSLDYYSLQDLNTQGVDHVTVRAVLKDGERYVGTAERLFYIPSTGVAAGQFIIGVADIRP